MEHAHKLILLPRDSVDKLQESQKQEIKSVQTPGNEMTRLDAEMSEILNMTTIDDSEKWKRYQQVLQRFLRMVENSHVNQILQSVQPDKSSQNGITDDAIVNTVPIRYRSKAQLLLNSLHNAPNKVISWDNKGVVTVNGSPIPRSNIIDLINEAMRARKTVNPVGRDQFARLLEEINAPRECIGNSGLWSHTASPALTLRVPAFVKGEDSTSTVNIESSAESESDNYVSGASETERKLKWSPMRFSKKNG